ncbi:MAG: hypothetical protein JRI95_13935, partial [Deltaproteobacteria bacterium]|nr:hypothetical protein [Deltaproteobacteria bacterium]
GTTKDPYLEVTLSGATTLIVDDGSHAHSAESPSLTQLHNLAVQEAEHVHSAENVNLFRIVILTVSGGTHSHIVDGITLSQIHHLFVANTYHVHLSDKIVFPGEKITETSIESLSMSREVEGLTGSMSLETLSALRTIESK